MASPHNIVDGHVVYDGTHHRVTNLSHSLHEIDVITMESQIPSDSQQQPAIGAQYSKVSFDEYVAGSGTRGTPPPNDALLKACGLKYDNSAGASDTYLWTKDFPADVTPIRIEVHEGNLYKQVCDMSVGSASWVFEVGQPAVFSYDGVGTYIEPVEEADATSLATEARAPVCINATATLAGVATVMKSMSINLNNTNNSPYTDMAGTLGVQVPILLDSNPTFEALFIVPTLATKNFHSAFTSGDVVPLAIVLGSTEGNIITIDVDGFITGIETLDHEGSLAHRVSLKMSKIAGDTRLMFVFT